MLATYPDAAEKGRVRAGAYRTARGDRMGAFALKAPSGDYLTALVSDGSDWAAHGLPGPAFEHVSVSVRPAGGQPGRCPTWDEMCWVKGLFWGPDECVLQYHPPAAVYVNMHPHTLHLWKPVGVEVLLPPSICVGVKA